MTLYPIHKHFLAGVLISSLIWGSGLYFYRAGINAGSVEIRAETTLDFRCDAGTKTVIWRMINKGMYRGELYKQCVK